MKFHGESESDNQNIDLYKKTIKNDKKTELLHEWNNQSSSICTEIKNFYNSPMILYKKSNKPNTYTPYLLIHLLQESRKVK